MSTLIKKPFSMEKQKHITFPGDGVQLTFCYWDEIVYLSKKEECEKDVKHQKTLENKDDHLDQYYFYNRE